MIHTLTIYKIGQIQVQLPHRHIYVVRIDAEAGLGAFGILFQSFAVRTLKRNRFEQDHHHQVEPPHLVRLSQAIDTPHLTLLVGIGEDAYRVAALSRDALHKVLAAFLRNVFS